MIQTGRACCLDALNIRISDLFRITYFVLRISYSRLCVPYDASPRDLIDHDHVVAAAAPHSLELRAENLVLFQVLVRQLQLEHLVFQSLRQKHRA